MFIKYPIFIKLSRNILLEKKINIQKYEEKYKPY